MDAINQSSKKKKNPEKIKIKKAVKIIKNDIFVRSSSNYTNIESFES